MTSENIWESVNVDVQILLDTPPDGLSCHFVQIKGPSGTVAIRVTTEEARRVKRALGIS